MKEGKTKIVEEFGSEVVLHFKDDITAGDGAKHDVIKNKGSICCEVTARTMKYLNEKGIYTMFLEYLPPNKLRARKLSMIPLEVIVRFKKQVLSFVDTEETMARICQNHLWNLLTKTMNSMTHLCVWSTWKY